MTESAIAKKILKHSGAMLSGKKWTCVCGFDLELPPESLLAPTTKQITTAWAKHLAKRLYRVGVA